MHSDHEMTLMAEARTALMALPAASMPTTGGVSLAEQFLACFEDLPPLSGYKFMPAAARRLHSQSLESGGPAATQEFLYAATIVGLLKTLESAAFARLPARIRQHQVKQYHRIVANAATIVPACHIDNDLFHKDFGLATIRLYAAAAQLVDFRAGMGRATLMKQGWRDLPRRLAIFMKIGGFKPFFEIHTHLAYLDEFNEEGWNECYRCCAELYAIHPDILGMYGGSWFYDPALATISPRLNYLREIPQKGGAYCLFDSVNEHSTHDAIATSPTRKALYNEGKYTPASYALIWPRAAQIAWSAAEHRASKSN